jgi:glutamyl-tRNA synthetase
MITPRRCNPRQTLSLQAEKLIRRKAEFMNELNNVRVRFAPSPTGPLHIGGVRTALYNYLFARRHKGAFILRIEDTDQNRFVSGAEDYIIESLRWAGILYDEGPDVGGSYGPYRQSDRRELYRQYADKLVEEGKAYYAFDTAEELEAMREKQKAAGASSQQYDSSTRGTMKNSLTLAADDVQKRLSEGDNFVLRFKMPEGRTIVVDDLIRGRVEVQSEQLDDKVLFKSDGMPTYHLANIVDDHLMEISHVIRGEEWLPSAPLHVMLYEAFGWQPPQFAHLPLLLKPDGNGKLSKRDGDRLGFPVFPLQWKDPTSGDISSGYREAGYFADAFVNMLALLGWNPGTEQEIFTMEELVEQFTIERVGKSGSKFDPAKAKWFNHQYLVARTDEEIAELYQSFLKRKDVNADFEFIKQIVSLVKERVTFVDELWDQSYFFFEAPTTYDEKVVKKQWKETTPTLLRDLKQVINDVSDYKAEAIKAAIVGYLERSGTGMGVAMNTLRLVLVGGSFGPDLMMIAGMLGREEVQKRIETALEKLP